MIPRRPAKRARARLAKEGNHEAARALDFIACGALNDIEAPDARVSEDRR